MKLYNIYLKRIYMRHILINYLGVPTRLWKTMVWLKFQKLFALSLLAFRFHVALM